MLYVQDKRQPYQSDCLECRVFEDLTDSTRVMLLWPATSSLIVEEHISTAVFTNFTTEVPFLIWVQGSFTPPEQDAVVISDMFPDLSSLNDRNMRAISDAAIDLCSVSVLTEDKDPSGDLTENSIVPNIALPPAIIANNMVVQTTGENSGALVEFVAWDLEQKGVTLPTKFLSVMDPTAIKFQLTHTVCLFTSNNTSHFLLNKVVKPWAFQFMLLRPSTNNNVEQHNESSSHQGSNK